MGALDFPKDTDIEEISVVCSGPYCENGPRGQAGGERYGGRRKRGVRLNKVLVLPEEGGQTWRLEEVIVQTQARIKAGQISHRNSISLRIREIFFINFFSVSPYFSISCLFDIHLSLNFVWKKR